jgi:hypothetical protein
MGVLLILLGLTSAGLLVGFIAENDLLSAPTQSFTMFGQDLHLSLSTMLIGAFAIGALTVALLVVGIGLLRGSWGRRRALKHRVADLERENTELRSRERLSEVVQAQNQPVQLPEAEEPTDITSGSRSAT